uniref:Ulp1 protease family, C-terminal catalytic domain containing protein n=1 Tax=Solanum tuberosum TaxID=4113 RepID=M1AV39_SOLTU
MDSLRQDFNLSKQLYRLYGMPYALNVWTYEFASQLNPEIAVKERNVIPRICNWRVVALKPKFEMLMTSIFQENACSNIMPTPEELAAFDLTEDEHDPPSSPTTTSVNPKIVQPNDIADFDDFSTRPPEQLLRRSSRVSDTSSPPPPKRRKKVYTPKTKVSEPSQPDQSNVSLNQPFSIPDDPPTPAANVHGSANAQKVNYVIPDIEELKDHLKNYVDKKFEELIILIKENHSQLMLSRHKENNKVDPQSSNKQPSSHIRTDFAAAFGVADFEDSSTSTTISPSTEAAIDALVSDLGKVPIPTKPLCVYNPQDLTGSHDLLSDSQLPIDIPTTEIVVRSHSKTPMPRNMMPSRIIQSPYVTSFGSSDKGKQKLDDDVRLYFPFEGCGITYQPSSKLIDEYMQWLTKGLLKNHANKKPSEDKYRSKASSFEFEMMNFVVAFPMNKNWFYAMSQPNKCWTDQHIDVVFYYLRKKSKLRSINQYRYTTANCLFISHIKNTYERYYLANDDDLISTQEHIDRASVVSVYERSITNIIKGFEIPAALPWHLVDDVYIPVNCGSRKKAIPHEINMLSKMLPSYLMDSGFFEKTERTSFVDCDAYKDNNFGSLLEAQVPFMVEFAQDIMQQKSDSLDCGLYVAIFAEYLSDQIETSYVDFLLNIYAKRYGALLWSYGSEKAKGAYVSENDDPPKPKSVVTQPPEEDLVHVV